ncbi:Wzz/FepE/Etk N-terminal domain-containing protein [Pseudomonadales bacterium]|nr:Wzz/FepE/Etk N-terminal domain-containing protein [Pseudomonadales bacterium]
MSIKSPEVVQNTEAYDDEIDLRELFTVLWDGKLVITLITGFAAVCAVLYALSLPNIYESKALLAPKGESGAGGLTGLARQYGGLASLAGINIGGGGGESSKAMIAQQKIKSLDFFTRHLYEKIVVELMAVDHWDAASGALVIDPDVFDVKSQAWLREASYPRQAKPSAQEAHEAFLGVLALSEDKKTSLVTIAIKHQSPVVAQAWVALIIEAVTEELRGSDVEEAQGSIAFLEQQRTQTSLVSLDEVFAQLIEAQTKTIMLANVSKDYVFNVIDPAVVPELKSEPKRVLICILGTLLGGMLAVLLVLVRRYAFGKAVSDDQGS